MKYLVTGGAGFIGSNIVDSLLNQGHKVRVFDNFSTGKAFFIEHNLKNPNFELIKGDLLDLDLITNSCAGIDFVFHFAAHADVRSGFEDHFIDHQQNLTCTHNVLEAMHLNNVKKIGFSSTSSVYGDAKIHPTPEDNPLHPTSLYGATKAACEAYIQSYASYYDWNAYIFRFVSWVGERYTHGIIVDLLKQLKTNPRKLELLSDGTPKKSSLYVKDGLDAIFTIIEKSKEKINIYNLGHDEILTVDEIVDTILKNSSSKVTKTYLGGKRGWNGDNDFVQLETTKLKSLGWSPKTSIKQGITKTVEYLQNNPRLLK